MLRKSLFIRILTIASLMLVNLQGGIASANPVDSETQSVILYVKPGADGDCQSWDSACELQTALFNATDGDQIWVALGTYKPSSSNREATFQLESGVAIYGGFPEAGGEWEERNWEANPTILSGEIGFVGDSTDNSFHIVTGNGVDSTAILDGFIITGGNANGQAPLYDSGGGLYNSNSNPTLSNITFTGNTANECGGAIYNDSGHPTLNNITFSGNTAIDGGGISNSAGSPTLTNITFTDNTATDGGGMSNSAGNPTLNNVIFSNNTATYLGGGFYNQEQGDPILNYVTLISNSASYGGGIFSSTGNPTLINVTISENSALNMGGGMYKDDDNPILTNVIFSGNSSGTYGGGLYNSGSTSGSILTNVTFSDNSASGYGGGMHNSGGYTKLTNVTFSGNSAGSGGGMTNTHGSPTLTNVTFTGNIGGGLYNYNFCSPDVVNAIAWDNSPYQIYGTGQVNYSDIQGGYPGTGNIDADPLLAALANNGGFTQTHAIAAGSPAIDTGDPVTCPVTDQRGFVRPIDGDGDGFAVCDMGAFEYDSSPAFFTLTLDVVGSGSIDANPEKIDYYYGEIVTLTSIADSDWVFTGWGGDVSSMENPISITIFDDTNISANFMFNAWVLTVSVYPEGAGSVSLNPDTPTYPYMSLVSATAIPNPGWTFAGWTGDASGTTNPTSVTMTSHKSITANFSQNEYLLNVTVNPEGVGSVAISPSKPNYHYGETVTLTATPSTGWKFTDWSGDATGVTNPLEVIITSDTNIIANFSNQFTLSTSVLPQGSGTVTRDNYQDTYEYGTVVTLTAVPNTGWKFDSWSGDATGSENPLQYTIVGDTVISANFIKEEYTLTATVNPEGMGSVSISPLKETYQYEDVVTLTATPATGWKFDSWSGDVTSTDNPLALTITGNTSVTANFTDKFYIYLPLILKN